MKNHILAATALAALISTSALAGEIARITDLSSGSNVTMRGYVDDVKSPREFVMRDDSGSRINVDIASNESLTLKKGDAITVDGTVKQGFFSTGVSASNVTVGKDLGEHLSNAVRGLPGLSTTDAQAFHISDLPRSGSVKITGTVSDVESDKEFTLTDKTGSVNVDITSAEHAALTKGARVTVIGNVNSGLFSKAVNASEVLVVADTNLSANF